MCVRRSLHLSAAVLVYLTSFSSSRAAEPHILEEITITAPAYRRYLDVPEADVAVISADEIRDIASYTLAGLLDSRASMYTIQRGFPGAQADVAIRGSSHEGVLVLINGVRMQDPQTAHFVLDVPVNTRDIERIELLKSGGSALYGAAASGGVVNIVTRKSRDEMDVRISGGSHGGAAVALSSPAGPVPGSVTVFGNRSDGYDGGHDFARLGAGTSGEVSRGAFHVDWYGGADFRDFGAENFYGSYPSAEKTLSVSGAVNGVWAADHRTTVSFRLGARGHGDEFTLVRNDPSFYRNTHYNRTYTSAVEYAIENGTGNRLSAGIEHEYRGITSGSLGCHDEQAAALYGSWRIPVSRWSASVNGRVESAGDGEVFLSPGFGLSRGFGGGHRFRLLAERSYRRPTYTERYYVSPANRGNPDLALERTINTETGVDLCYDALNVSVSLFSRHVANPIDWVRDDETDPWRAVNHGKIYVYGIDSSLDARLADGWTARLSLMTLRRTIERTEGTESKYILRFPEKILGVGISGSLFFNTDVTLRTRYEDGGAYEYRMPLDVSVRRGFGAWGAFLTVQNAGNDRYEIQPLLSAPGRLVSMGLDYSL